MDSYPQELPRTQSKYEIVKVGSTLSQLIINILKPRQNGNYFAESIFSKLILVNENCCILIQI